jgi:hypothetical protein
MQFLLRITFLAATIWLLFVLLICGLLWYNNGVDVARLGFYTYGYKWYTLLAVAGFAFIGFTFIASAKRRRKPPIRWVAPEQTIKQDN